MLSAIFKPVCAQCEKFDSHRNVCEGKLELLEGDRSVAVRPKAQANNPACDRFIELLDRWETQRL